MSVTVSLDDELTRGRDVDQLTHDIKEAVLLYDYVTARISLGEFAQSMKMPLLDAREWLHKKGIPTSRLIRDPELVRAVEDDRKTFLQSLDASS